MLTSNMGKKNIYVVLPFATFGITIIDGVVTEAPPIARFLIGKSEGFAKEYVVRKGKESGWKEIASSTSGPSV